MVRHNNEIPNNHFHKAWQLCIKPHFNQPLKKQKRHKRRCLQQLRRLPKPVSYLRPIVHCSSVRYNTKQRIGRGFTLQELKAAGIDRYYAKTIGISIDYRRKNASLEAVLLNLQRLKEYNRNLIMLPSKETYVPRGIINKVEINVRGGNKATIPSQEEKEFRAFEKLRKARLEGKVRRKKAKMMAAEEGMK